MATVQTDINALTSLGIGQSAAENDLVVGGAVGAYTFTFGGYRAGTEQSLLVANGSGLTGTGEAVTVSTTANGGLPTTGAVTVAANAELDLLGGGSVQTITVAASGGNFDLSFGGQTTSDISFNDGSGAAGIFRRS